MRLFPLTFGSSDDVDALSCCDSGLNIRRAVGAWDHDVWTRNTQTFTNSSNININSCQSRTGRSDDLLQDDAGLLQTVHRETSEPRRRRGGVAAGGGAWRRLPRHHGNWSRLNRDGVHAGHGFIPDPRRTPERRERGRRLIEIFYWCSISSWGRRGQRSVEIDVNSL